MRLAYLTGQYPRATDTFVQREVAALRALGVEVCTFAARQPSDAEIVSQDQREERERTTYLLPPRVSGFLAAHLGFLMRSPRRYFGTLRLAWRTSAPGWRDRLYQLFYFAEAALLAHELRQRAIDHLHNHFANSSCSVAMLAAELAGKPFSFTMHGPAIFFEPKRWRIDEKIRRARFVACISWFCRSQAMVFASPADWPKLRIIHCGVSPAEYMPVRHEGPGRRLLFVGRLAAVKGVPVLLEAMQRIRQHCPQATLTLVGDGVERVALERQVREMGLAEQVRFAGYRSQSEVAELLREHDVFVLPSFAEGVPVVLMEALATGVPVVATRIAGVAELVEEGRSGHLVPPGDAESLAERVIELLQDSDLRQRMGEHGRAKVEREFNLLDEARRLHTLFQAEDVASVRVRPESITHSRPTAIPVPSPSQGEG